AETQNQEEATSRPTAERLERDRKCVSQATSNAADPSSSCPPHWIFFLTKCYLFSGEKKSRHESEESCEAGGGSLASVTEKHITLRRFINITSQEYWIGLTKIDNRWSNKSQRHEWTGKWTDGTIEVVLEGSGSCAKLGGHLYLDNCYAELQWICEREALQDDMITRV
ncbi:hypothetical protein FKM82_019023, partial [Ascaphus truei]